VNCVDALAMSTSNTLRSRVSRETRQLLVAALIALLALWVLARIRFPGQPASPNPIPSLLSQLSVAPRFANLAGEIAELQGKLAGSWMTIPVSANDSLDGGSRQLAAMRLPDDAALALFRRGDRLPNDKDLIGIDRVTGLAIIHAEGTSTTAEIARWMPSALDSPRYLMTTVTTPTGVSLRPVLVGALHETESPAWPGPILLVPEGTDLTASAFVFTTAGEIAGLVVREPSGLAIIPWDTLVTEAARIRDRGLAPPADLRVEVQPLTPALARATGATRGVVVAWVDPASPMAERLAVGDVIESLNAQPIVHLRTWEVASSRLPTGNAAFSIRRRGKPLDLQVALPAPSPLEATGSLGLSMKDVPGVGTTVLRVDARSAAHAAQLREGDVITLAGEITAPTAKQIGDAFRSARTGEAIMLAITRGRTHLVVGLVK
jgi:hypothetical protein